MRKIPQEDACSLSFPKIEIKKQRLVIAHLDAVQAEVDEMRHLQAQDADLLDQLER
jgi:hypothetical protein